LRSRGPIPLRADTETLAMRIRTEDVPRGTRSTLTDLPSHRAGDRRLHMNAFGHLGPTVKALNATPSAARARMASSIEPTHSPESLQTEPLPPRMFHVEHLPIRRMIIRLRTRGARPLAPGRRARANGSGQTRKLFAQARKTTDHRTRSPSDRRDGADLTTLSWRPPTREVQASSCSLHSVLECWTPRPELMPSSAQLASTRREDLHRRAVPTLLRCSTWKSGTVLDQQRGLASSSPSSPTSTSHPDLNQ
jgi:hypothetical protein